VLSPRAGRGVHARGFTLIELLIAFVLLALLVRLGLPSFSLWIGNAKVRAGAESLQAGIRLAQAEAVRSSRQVVLTFTNAAPALDAAAAVNGRHWSIQSVPLFGNGTDDDTRARFVQGGELGDAAAGVVVDTGGLTALCFNANGRLVLNAAPGPAGASCSAANASFTVSHPNGDRPLKVMVGVAGQTRSCDPNRPARSASSPDGCP
jgi:type IV fimbrial biogenesis protein FimT